MRSSEAEICAKFSVMFREGLLIRLWNLVRNYAVAVILVAMVAVSFIQVYTVGTGPVPQLPPEGYVIQRGTAQLQWSKGTREGEIRLQVSVDDPSFADPVVERKATGNSHSMNKLKPNVTYYWRLVQGEKTSPVATFRTPLHNVRF